MKKIKSIIVSFLMLLSTIAPIGVIPIALTACQSTSPLTSNFKTYGQLRTDVAAARIDWADWVVAQKTAAGNIADRSQQSIAMQAILAKQAAVNSALQVWFDRLTVFKDAEKASAQTLPAPPALLDAGNSYLATVKVNKL